MEACLFSGTKCCSLFVQPAYTRCLNAGKCVFFQSLSRQVAINNLGRVLIQKAPVILSRESQRLSVDRCKKRLRDKGSTVLSLPEDLDRTYVFTASCSMCRLDPFACSRMRASMSDGSLPMPDPPALTAEPIKRACMYAYQCRSESSCLTNFPRAIKTVAQHKRPYPDAKGECVSQLRRHVSIGLLLSDSSPLFNRM